MMKRGLHSEILEYEPRFLLSFTNRYMPECL